MLMVYIGLGPEVRCHFVSKKSFSCMRCMHQAETDNISHKKLGHVGFCLQLGTTSTCVRCDDEIFWLLSYLPVFIGLLARATCIRCDVEIFWLLPYLPDSIGLLARVLMLALLLATTFLSWGATSPAPGAYMYM